MLDNDLIAYCESARERYGCIVLVGLLFIVQSALVGSAFSMKLSVAIAVLAFCIYLVTTLICFGEKKHRSPSVIPSGILFLSSLFTSILLVAGVTSLVLTVFGFLLGIAFIVVFVQLIWYKYS